MAGYTNGVIARLRNWVSDRDAGIKIRADYMDAEFDHVIEALNEVTDGSAKYLGAMRAYAGSVSLPGYAFDGDLDSGIYRIGANNIGIAVNGAKALDVSATTVLSTLPLLIAEAAAAAADVAGYGQYWVKTATPNVAMFTDDAGTDFTLMMKETAPDTITFVFDGGGAVLPTGIWGDLEIPFACTITQATLLGDQSGSLVIDIWKDTYGNFPPTDADSITASAPPTISTATKAQDATLTGWTTSITAGDILRFNVDSVTSITRATLSLKIVRA